MNNMNGGVATWLELAVAPAARLDTVRVRLHMVGDDAEGVSWFALTVNDRLLYATEGKLTLLRGREAVDRFLFLIGLHASECGEPIRLHDALNDRALRLHIESDDTLKTFGELTFDSLAN